MPRAAGAVLTAAARALAFAVLVVIAGTAANAAAEPPRLSLLALGDTGASPDDPDQVRNQLAVAAAMAASHRAQPAHALVLLGDNFYPDGLRRHELVARVRSNLVRPYCRFLEIAAGATAVAGACPTPPGERHPVPVYATLGNHDYRSPASPELQRAEIGRLVANWNMPAGAAAAYELGGGVSLVVFESSPLFEDARFEAAMFEAAGATALARALRASRGPWRILAAHHPIANRDRGSEAARHARYRRAVLAAVAAAQVPVQLVLAAHEHNLQLLAMDSPAPALHAIAGGGSGARSLHGPDPQRKVGFEEPGFARVDLVADAAGRARLAVSLLGLPRFPRRLWSDRPRLLARWSVDLAGRVVEE